ncbi:MAG: hypothetical protein ACLTR6_05845 [Clostridium fessum]
MIHTIFYRICRADMDKARLGELRFARFTCAGMRMSIIRRLRHAIISRACQGCTASKVGIIAQPDWEGFRNPFRFRRTASRMARERRKYGLDGKTIISVSKKRRAKGFLPTTGRRDGKNVRIMRDDRSIPT